MEVVHPPKTVLPIVDRSVRTFATMSLRGPSSVLALSRVLGRRALSTTSTARPPVSRRAMLYVPGSNPRMLEKSLTSLADSICYDLEDAVAPGKKADARRAVCDLLDVCRL